MIDEALGSTGMLDIANHICIKIGDYYFQIARTFFNDENIDKIYKISCEEYETLKSKRSTIILDMNTISIDECTMNSIMSEIRISKLDKALND
jgi:hypothetical protein